jgi:hypothetical protein
MGSARIFDFQRHSDAFVDGRVELYGNQFLRRYFDAMKLINPDDATQLLKENDVRWALLHPEEPIALCSSPMGGYSFTVINRQ